MPILQFRIRAYDATSSTWVVGVYDTRDSAERVCREWQFINKSARYVVEPNP